MVNQIKKMITIETVVEVNNNNNNNNSKYEYENEFMNVLSREQIQIKSENKTEINSKSTKINRSVPETHTIVQEKEQVDEVKTKQYINSSVPDSRTIVQDFNLNNTSTEKIKNTKEQSQIYKDKTGNNMEAHVHKVTENTVLGQGKTNTINSPIQKNNETNPDQIIDTRLILINKNGTMADEFTNIIREYNTYGNSSINEVGAYIINRVECQYKINKAYQQVARAARTKMNFQINSSDLTPAYTPAASLASMDVPNHSINAVRIQSATKRKTVKVKFQIKKMNRSIDKNENENGKEIFQVKQLSKNIDKNEYG
jgi:hypothetical protein